ncbi:hypothetical protein BJ971_003883 [Actinoplanes digitatis]|uniref:DUF2332 domain-containing protein n=1 Tax=Actinoplanes digitatis TaxID=1868 RepID=A0A7W7MR29_9ACTN|nr:hypothetical protein [Actinoplanes digitatis]
MTIAQSYADFGTREARGESPAYERLALAVSADPELLALIATLPPAKQQPNLLFGVVRFLGGPVEDPAAFHDFVVANWAAIAPQIRSRATQTNEAGRCTALLPVLAALPGPLALLEVGASAGLCLYPDRYAYRYGDHRLGNGGPLLECEATGLTPPARIPEVVWRAGLDLNPLARRAPRLVRLSARPVGARQWRKPLTRPVSSVAMFARSAAACWVLLAPSAVEDAISATPETVRATSPLLVAASLTDRLISAVVAVCSSTADAIVVV